MSSGQRPGDAPDGGADRFGVQRRYRGADHQWREVPDRTVRILHERIGDARISAVDPVRVLRAGGALAEPGPGVLVLEDGTSMEMVGGPLPADLPPGYHRFHRPDGSETLFIVTPEVCPPPPRRGWGWAVQVYAARSRESWGIGDLADVRRLARWAGSAGARMLLLSPLGADTPAPPLEPSPYYPSSRRFRNPLHLRVEEVPGADGLGPELDRLGSEGRALNRDRNLDRDAVWSLKESALSRIWAASPARATTMEAFRTWRSLRGAALEEFATFCTIAETHGRGWRNWPAELRRPGAPAVERFAAEHADRIGFHAWLQWLLDRQLEAASESLTLMQDLPIGVEPGGADAWAWQDLLAEGVGVGAPPDDFNPDGQDWGIPPFIPWRLRAAGYAPFVETLRALLAHGSWARIDHVMGLFRLFWIPKEVSSAEGGYVRYPSEDLLGILALEADRAGAVIVGEDLGTVEEGVREELASRNILSYRLLWFEDAPPQSWPESGMAAVTTHDLPTVAGIWSGAELEAQHSVGIDPDQEALGALRARLEAVVGSGSEVGAEEAIEAVYRRLGHARCRLLSATLDDAMAVEERPNMPGVASWPNWRIALPRPIETLENAALPSGIAEALSAGEIG